MYLGNLKMALCSLWDIAISEPSLAVNCWWWVLAVGGCDPAVAGGCSESCGPLQPPTAQCWAGSRQGWSRQGGATPCSREQFRVCQSWPRKWRLCSVYGRGRARDTTGGKREGQGRAWREPVVWGKEVRAVLLPSCPHALLSPGMCQLALG